MLKIPKVILIYLKILLFKFLMNLSAKSDFALLCAECILIPLSYNYDFIDLL